VPSVILARVMAIAIASGCAPAGGEGETVSTLAASIPAWGRPDTLDVATWNLEWFGSQTRGPGDEGLQLANAAAVVEALEVDLWAVQEIVSRDQFLDLVDQLPGYRGLLANDFSVDGNGYYSQGEQKVGIIYRDDLIDLNAARVILRDANSAFAGRPPLELELVVAGRPLVVVVLHAKASGAWDDWTRRRAGAEALADYLAEERPGQDLLVIGDFNDDLDQSIRSSQPSPYADLVAGHYFATWDIAASNTSTRVSGGLPLDHAMATGWLPAAHLETEVFRADDHIDDYGHTTSDHRPVLVRFAQEAEPEPDLVLNEILANETGWEVDGEFVEIVNPGAAPVDLGGWTLADGAGVRHVFDAGTIIAAGGVVTVSAGADFAPQPTIVASTGALGLNNAGDTVTLADASGAPIAELSYPAELGAADGVSMTRAGDGDGESAMLLHDQVSTLPASPGLRRDGTGF
jgi:endonuclease/exonuclease/phosphatase family metal-dependent hydrolase